MATLTDLAALVKGVIYGDETTVITGIAGIEDAKPDEITFAASPQVIENAMKCQASAVIIPHMENNPVKTVSDGKSLVEVANPRLAFAQILNYFFPPRVCRPGINPTAIVGNNFQGEDCEIGPLVVVGDDVSIGRGTVISPGVVIGNHVSIGSNSIIHANVTIYDGSVVGNHVQIHAGTVIGSDGFGYVTVEGKHFKIPQVGQVVIEDEVEIGSNVSIDRATTGTTLVKKGTKIDNLVQIAHNCEVGEDNIICGQVALAGSSKLSDRITMAGRSGTAGHLKIGNDTVVAGCSVAVGNIAPYSFVSGFPARPHAEDMRIQAATGRLPNLLKEFRELQKRVAELEGKIPS